MAGIQSITLLFCFDNSVIMYLILQSLVEPRVPDGGHKMLSTGCGIVHRLGVVFKFCNSKMILSVEHMPLSPPRLPCYCKMQLLH